MMSILFIHEVTGYAPPDVSYVGIFAVCIVTGWALDEYMGWSGGLGGDSA